MKFKDNRLSRVLRRLFGEEKGQAMMEYLVLAVLIVAAAVFAVVKFGGTIVRQFNVASTAASGDEKEASTRQAASQETAVTDADSAVTANAGYSKLQESGSAPNDPSGDPQ